MIFVLASFNPDKARELKALLGRPEIELRTLAGLPGAVTPVEDGDTLIDNARIKARAALALTGLPAIADDTGLEVDALGGAPGVYSARFAGPGASYGDNMRLLLERLSRVPEYERTARFRTVCIALFPDGREFVGEGVLEGSIASAPRGLGGFGYDPVFELPGLGRTLAQLNVAEKNAMSHRARAVRALAEKLAAA